MPSTIASARRDVVDGDEQIGDEFHLAAVAERAEVVRQAREPGEDRGATLVGGAVARGIDDEVARHRLRAGAAQRAIEERYTGFGEGIARALLRLDRQCAQFGHDEILARLGEIGGDGLVDRGDAGQAGEDHLGDVGDLGGGARRCAAHGVELVAPLGDRSKPITVIPAAIRLRAIAEPMMPTPTMPTFIPLLP